MRPQPPQQGQALIETAVTLPILIMIFFGFVGAGVAAQGYVDLNTAVHLAAASNVTAYADERAVADQYALDTFEHTLAHDSLLRAKGVDGHPPSWCEGNYAAGGQVTCHGSAVLEFSRTPLAILFIRDPVIQSEASAVRSPYRSRRP